MNLEILTPEKKIFEGTVKLVRLPGTKGSFEVLNNHAPLISTLEKGQVKIVLENDETSYIDVKSGVVEVNQNRITILADV